MMSVNNRSSCTGRRAALAGLAVLSVAFALGAARAEPPRLVLAHYLVCCPRDGHDATVENFKDEIRFAQSRKIDGFALNLTWFREAYYPAITRRLFQAAAELASGFRLIFSLDHSEPGEGAAIVAEFAQHPNYYRIGDRPVVSSYSGSPAWGRELKAQLARRGIDPFFVPNYQYLSDLPLAPNYITPTARFLDRLYRQNPELDGYFFFALELGYKAPLVTIPTVAERSRAAGKISMVGISPFYRGMWHNSRVFEGGGFQGMAAQWRAAIAAGADWVQIVTWKDWAEATYVAPFGAPTERTLWNNHWGPLLAHVKFLEASEYFIDWFKSGRPPPIARDRLFYFYRPHLKDALGIVDPSTGERGRPRGWPDLDDRLYVTAFLTRPLALDAVIGGRAHAATLSRGLIHVDFPLAAGPITLALRDGAHILTTKTLEFPVTASAEIGNFNYFAGEMELP